MLSNYSVFDINKLYNELLRHIVPEIKRRVGHMDQINVAIQFIDHEFASRHNDYIVKTYTSSYTLCIIFLDKA